MMQAFSTQTNLTRLMRALLLAVLLAPTAALAEREPEGVAAKLVVSTIDEVRNTVKASSGEDQDA
ncbi:MAG: hypothetical protein KDD66_14480, partial [Bdellovibrionales bacterium]|nr:hypothetical protein [Bdellovibrionales bacterium]